MRPLLLFIAFFHVASVWGQLDKTRYLSLQEGLSNQQVLDIAHDGHGFVWIATELGLNRFASGSFKHYYKSEKTDGLSVNSNEINTLFYDNGQLYIGTRANGLNVLNLKTNRFSYYVHDADNDKSIATNDITDIIKGKNGQMWLATYHQGIQLFDTVKKQFEHFNTKNTPSLPENSIWTLAEDQQGLLYIGHVNKGLSILNTHNGTVELLDVKRTNGMLPDNEVKALFCDSKNNIWIGTRKGLAVYNPQKRTVNRVSLAKYARNTVEPFVYSIQEIDGAIWAGAEFSQLFIIQSDVGIDKDVQQVRNTIPFILDRGNNASVQHISPDRFGNIWLAIYGGGIGFISHLKPFFTIFPAPEKRSDFDKLATVTAILQDKDKSTWLATGGNGIIQMGSNGQMIRKWTAENSGLTDNFLLSAFQDRRGNKWFGLQKGGVSFFDARTERWHKIDAGEKITEVRAMLEDSRGNIWLAAQEGLFIQNPGRKVFQKVLINKPMLGDYGPRTLVEDSHGCIWVGTYGQGLYLFNADRKLIRKISERQGLKSNTINHLFRDRRNNIWIATNEGITFQSVNKETGQLENIVPPGSDAWSIVNALAEDRNGNIWCSTKSGLLRYLPEQKRFLSYDYAFGLPLGGFVNNSVASDNRGRLFFGMQEGICYFEPTEIPLKLPMSPITVSRFTVFNTGEHAQLEKHPSLTDEIYLKHYENSFRIELAVMDYALNDLIEFSYKLQGLDNDWTFLGSEKSLDFRNIPYGKYELRIRTRQKNENWPGDCKRLFIDIAPPFYLSIYAIVLYTLLAAGLGFVLVFFYVKKIKAEAELRLKKHQLEHDEKLYAERLNFYTNITHELRTPLTLILGPLDDLLHGERLSSQHKNLVHTVQKSANRLFSLVNQLLEFRKVESQYKPLVLGEGFLGEMLQEIVQKYKDANTRKELIIKCIVPDVDIKTSFDAETVQLVLDNLLSNACKFTSTGSIVVSLRYEQATLSTWAVINVRDTGCGIAPEHLNKIFDKFYQVPRSATHGTGVGLALVKELVAIHHGKISVKSEPGVGSDFCVRLLTNTVAASSDEDSTSHLVAPYGEPADNQHPLVLLVEDDIDLREYLTTLLSSKYEVISAENGNIGFELAKSCIPDLILSDILMPDMDGFEMLERLKRERETSHIPTIFLTAKDTEADRQLGYELGVDSYLHKPVSVQLLYRRIENLLLKRKAVFAEVLRQLSSDNRLAESGEMKPDEELWRENAFVQEFVKLVEDCIQDEVLDATTLADKMNMSQSTLYRKLKGLTGKNINQLVRKVRIQKAAQLLRSGQYNITEVSFMVGINSSIYFRQCFKEEFGQLPSEYQKEASNSRKGQF